MTKNFTNFKELEKKFKLDQVKAKKIADLMMAISNAYRLAELRKNEGITQNALADDLGIDQSYISRIENSKLSKTEIGTLQAYVEGLGGTLEIYARIKGKSFKLID
jgi:predicted transcriptional regulator